MKASSSPGNELKKQFDAGVKGNIFHLNGHKIQWPFVAPNSSGQSVNSGRISSSKHAIEKTNSSKNMSQNQSNSTSDMYNH